MTRMRTLLLFVALVGLTAACGPTTLAPAPSPTAGELLSATDRLPTSIPATPSGLGVNVAAGRPVIERGGGVDWEEAIDSVDFNSTTDPGGGGWLNQTNYGTFQVVDLGRIYRLHGVGYDLMWDGAYVSPLTFVIEVSTDGQTWKEVSRIVHPYGAAEGSNFVDVDIPLDAVEARYVRYSEPDDGSWNGWGNIFQLRAFAPAVLPIAAATPTASPWPPTSSPIPPIPVLAARPTEDEVWSVPSLWNYFNLADLLNRAEPGTTEFAAALTSDRPLTWPFLWCATDPERLAQNLSTISVEFSIDGVVVPADDVLELDTETEEWSCHYWVTLLTDWHSGSEASLRVQYSLDQRVNDGQRDFPAGDYAYIVLVDTSY